MSKKLSPKAIEVLCRHKSELHQDIDDVNMLPLFIDALQTGGLKLFDEVRYALEYSDVDINDKNLRK